MTKAHKHVKISRSANGGLKPFARKGLLAGVLLVVGLSGAAQIDTTLLNGTEEVGSEILSQVQQKMSDHLKQMGKRGLSIPQSVRPDAAAVAALRSWQWPSATAATDINGWALNGVQTLYGQSRVSLEMPVLGLPLGGELLHTRAYQGGAGSAQTSFRISYTKAAFLDRLKLDENQLKQQVLQENSFDRVVDPGSIFESALAKLPGIDPLLQKANCSLQDLQELPLSELRRRFGVDSFAAKMADAGELQSYYLEAAAHTGSAAVSRRLVQADSLRNQLAGMQKARQKLLALRERLEQVLARIDALRKAYDERLQQLSAARDFASEAIQSSKDLTGIQKFFSKVKGLTIGQHSLSAGTLVLQQFLQNGATLDMETDRSFLILTVGSQDHVPFDRGLFRQSIGAGVSEYFRFEGRYSLAGISIGRGNRGGAYTQFSVMHFQKGADSLVSPFSPRKVTVFTTGRQWVQPGRKLLLEVSKSLVRQEVPAAQPQPLFWESMAAFVRFDSRKPEGQSQQAVTARYVAPGYNNPGLSSGTSFPGLKLVHQLQVQVTKPLRLLNEISLYSIDYGTGTAYRSWREKLQARYKIKRWRLGILTQVAGSSQAGSKTGAGTDTHTSDLLATAQTSFAAGRLTGTFDGGIGSGWFVQEQGRRSSDLSLYLQSRVGLGRFSLDLSADKFNTRNTEVFRIDSTARLLFSSFNAAAMLGYEDRHGNLAEAGYQLRFFDGASAQGFIMASYSVRIGKVLTGEGQVNIPLQEPLAGGLPVNLYSTRIIYKIR